ncbi:MAG: HAMP domain-containing histidine kinase [Ruminococcus sp.]|nr:HAMP domain-containing histidine kinase [Ruminococcus sp.]
MSPQRRHRLVLQILVSVLGALSAGYFSPWSALILAAVSAVLIAAPFAEDRRRRQQIGEMCDEIDRVLRGSDRISLDSYQEGELSILASEIRKMTIRLREQNSALREEKIIQKEALEDMSHQLRTPLTSMLLIMDFLRDPELTRQGRMEYLNELSGLLDHMQRLIWNMLSLSRLEAGAVSLSSERVDCRSLISQAAEPLSIALELHGISLEVELDGDPAFVGDPAYTREALTNILKNCLEHAPDGGRIRVNASENPIYCGITVEDSGEGIPEEELAHIFDRFHSSSKLSGFGIGLAFARKVVSMENGSLQASNSEGGGAVFDMRFYKSVV